MKGVYKITCKTNGKVYIGESEDVFRRWEEHTHFSNPVRELQRDLTKHGVHGFTFELLEPCYDKEKRKQLETDYIVKHQSFIKSKGYNSRVYLDDSYKELFDPDELIKRRKDKAITRKQLADTLIVSENHLKVVEKGQAKPSKIGLFRLAHALNCSITDFYKKGGVA